MLEISKISYIDAYGEAWKKERRGKISASLASKLVGDNSDKGKFKQTAITYIEGLAGERITGTAAKADFHTDYTDYGNSMEMEAIEYFCKVKGKSILRGSENGDSHKLIHLDDYVCCTPDALVLMAKNEKDIFDETGTKMKVAPLETKCPPVLHRFIKLYKCTTPLELKDTAPDYFYQVILQMVCCNSLLGYFAAYNPNFPEGKKMRIIEFKKMELVDEFKKFQKTLDYAKKEIQEIEKLFSN